MDICKYDDIQNRDNKQNRPPFLLSNISFIYIYPDSVPIILVANNPLGQECAAGDQVLSPDITGNQYPGWSQLIKQLPPSDLSSPANT